MKNRIIYLDVLRVLAISMVILMHTAHPDAGVPGYVQVGSGLFAIVGVPLFFMVSGALILPVKSGMFPFLKHRLKRIVPPMVIWSLFYVFIKWIYGELDFLSFIKSICGIPFSYQGISELWFLYVLLSLYFLAPILSSFLKSSSKREIEFYIFLWAIALSLPFVTPYLNIDEGTWGMFHYFMGFAGFFVLGYYLHYYHVSANIWQCSLMIFLPLLVFSLYKLMGWIDSWSEWHFYKNICVATCSTGVFLLTKQLLWNSFDSSTQNCCNVTKEVKENGLSFLVELSNCSFGVYLIHIFVMRRFLWSFDFIVYGFGWIGQMVLTWTLTMLLSFTITYLISLLPYGEYVVGVSQRKRKR